MSGRCIILSDGGEVFAFRTAVLGRYVIVDGLIGGNRPFGFVEKTEGAWKASDFDGVVLKFHGEGFLTR